MKKRVLNAINRRSSNRLFALLGKSTQNGCMKLTSCNSISRVFLRFATIGKVEKTRFEGNKTTFVIPAFCAAWKSPKKNGGMKPNSWDLILREFIRFATMWKVEKTRFYRNYTTLYDLIRPRAIGSQGCFFVSPRWVKSKKTRFERNWTTFVNPAFCPAWKSPHKMVV